MYEEVIKDINELKKSAEESAIKSITEAVTPKIREFIENQIMGSAAGDDFGGGESLGDPFSDTEDDATLTITGLEVPEDTTSTTITVKPVKPVEELPVEPSEDSNTEQVDLDVLTDNPDPAFDNRLKRLESKIRSIKENKFSSLKEISSTMIRVGDMYAYVKRTFGKLPLQERYCKILSKHQITLAELRKMKKISEDVTITLKGLPEDIDLSELGVELENDEETDENSDDLNDDTSGEDFANDDESGEVEDSDLSDDSDGDDESSDTLNFEGEQLSDDDVVEIDESMLRKEIAKMRAVKESKKPSTSVPKTDGHGPGDVSDDWEADNLGDPFTDVSLTESDDMEECDECDKMESEMPPSNLPESAKRDFRVQSKLQAEAYRRQQKAKSFYSKTLAEAKKLHEMAVSCKKKKDQTGYKKAVNAFTAKKKSLSELKSSYTFFSKKLNECTSAKKALIKEGKSKNSQPANKSNTLLEKKLAETNLFNAKLMHANQVLQNENIDKKTQADIIDRLDEAANVREVKVIYDSLMKTLSNKKQIVKESAGSSSRPVTSGSPKLVNESFEVKRWAELAGILRKEQF